MIKKAIVLLSGGLDSTTVAKIAINSGFEVYALSFSYGQRHEIELEFAKKISKNINVKEHKIAKIDLRTFGGSALTDEIDVPKDNESSNFNQTSIKKIPITYVPARNTIFLSYALAYAEVVGAFDIFIGVNAIDYSGYPDCRPEFIETFEKLANLATAAGVENSTKFKIHTPLIKLSKKEIIELGIKNGVDYSITHSCYDPIIENENIISCGKCDSCRLRLEGFRLAGIEDELEYL
ncbi:MAG: 7-cyano-7-deazaguanine synthase QueC [Pelagibacterales bacterium]|nr:7-cyano-7-deazaguanine synthase QueC [Pelagibacterales bacterium]